jgi:hypothetical protein
MNDSMGSKDDFYRPKQLAERLPAFTYRQIKWLLQNRERNGLARYVKRIGRNLYIREQDFMEWLDQQTEK